MKIDTNCTQCGKLNKIDIGAVQTEYVKFMCSDCQAHTTLKNPQYQNVISIPKQKAENSIGPTIRRISGRAKVIGLVVLLVAGLLIIVGGRTVIPQILSAIGISHQTVRITSGEWAPYCSENLEQYGMALHIITEAFALEGVKVDYSFFPWDQAMDKAQTKDWDGTAAWFRSPEREENYYISDPVVMSGYVFFYMKSLNLNWKTMDDLKKYKIGATKGYDYGKAFQEAEKQGIIHVKRLATDEMNFDNLLNGKIDIFPEDIDVGMNLLYHRYPYYEYTNVTAHTKRLREDPLHLLLSKSNPKNQKLMKLFNKGLKKLIESGDYDRCVQKYRHGEE
ncbi:MAG: transporter substrate-binding domain-containing protein [Desulfobacteraceae bacterium]|jgi:polar amino acid transport system substrate-binding protein